MTKMKFIAAVRCVLLTAALLFVGVASIQSANKKAPTTGFSTLMEVLAANGMETDGLNLKSELPTEKIDSLKPEILKAFKIKGKESISFGKNPTVSSVLIRLMVAKTKKMGKMKPDFAIRQYNVSMNKLREYEAQYPNSPYSEEIQARIRCLRQDSIWRTIGKTTRHLDRMREYAEEYREPLACDFDDLKTLVEQNNRNAQAINAWTDLADHPGADSVMLQKYEAYAETYDYFPVLAQLASDSMEVVSERMDWKRAVAENKYATYKKYVKDYSDGLHVREAKAKIADFEAWTKAALQDTYLGYAAYYRDYPNGEFADKAAEKLKEREEAFWQETKKKNTLAAYDAFTDRFPNGYYSSEAQNKAGEMRFSKYKDDTPTISGMKSLGSSSEAGYSYVCLGNIDNSSSMTISLMGPTGFSRTFKHGQMEWVKVKNGHYRVLVQASNVQNWWGNSEFESGVYGDAWYTSNSINGFAFGSNKDEKAEERIIAAIRAKILQEALKLYK